MVNNSSLVQLLDEVTKQNLPKESLVKLLDFELFESFYIEIRNLAPSQVDFLGLLNRNDLNSNNHLIFINNFFPVLVKRLESLLTNTMLWVEFDDITNQTKSSEENLHFCLIEGYPNNLVNYQVQRALTCALEVLGFISRGKMTFLQETIIRQCFENLPTKGRIIHVSSMLARTPAVFKLYGCVLYQDFLPYLEKIAWSGNYNLLGKLNADLYKHKDDYVFFDLSVSNQLDSYIGIVKSQYTMPDFKIDNQERQLQLIDYLVAKNLCLESKAIKLKKWLSDDIILLNETTQLKRWLDLKISIREDNSIDSKSYFGFKSVPYFDLKNFKKVMSDKFKI